jgi:hypothetical protein
VRELDDRDDDEDRCDDERWLEDEVRDEPDERVEFPWDRVPRRDSLLMVLQLQRSSIFRIRQVDSLLPKRRRHQLCRQ